MGYCSFLNATVSIIEFIASFIFLSLIFLTEQIHSGFNSFISVPLFPSEDDPFGTLYTGKPYLKDGKYYVNKTLSEPYVIQLFTYYFSSLPKKSDLNIYHNLKEVKIELNITVDDLSNKKVALKKLYSQKNFSYDTYDASSFISIKKLYDFSKEFNKLTVSCPDPTLITNFFEANSLCSQPGGFPILVPEKIHKGTLISEVPFRNMYPGVNISISSFEAQSNDYYDPPFLFLYSAQPLSYNTVYICLTSIFMPLGVITFLISFGVMA